MTQNVITTETGINRTIKSNADLTIEKYNNILTEKITQENG